MSSLNDVEKCYLEKILNMESGYVLYYSNPKFGELFKRYGIDIHSSRYQTDGTSTSKAKKMRAFWELESDILVSSILTEMLDSYEANCELSNNLIVNKSLLEKSRKIVSRLSENPLSSTTTNIEDFLHNEFKIPNIKNLPIESIVATIIEDRLNEAMLAFGAKAYLSVIFLCGSVLEAVLLGAAQKNPENFNNSTIAPKDKEGKVKKFHEWNLSQFIDVACEINILKPDIKKFSHGLRDFRNYIHPDEQISSGFKPDEHTAKLCLQVLKAALANIAGERK